MLHSKIFSTASSSIFLSKLYIIDKSTFRCPMPYLENDIRNILNFFTEIIKKLSDDWKNHKRKKL
jgi:hypothetical protein